MKSTCFSFSILSPMPLRGVVLGVACLGAYLLPTNVMAATPGIISYQGRVQAGGADFNGPGLFKFALVDATGATTYWSNNGSSTAGIEPSAAVSLTVTKGLYAVLLGDTTIANMTAAIPSSVFNNNTTVKLRVWFNDGTHGSLLLSPDARIAAVGYALNADTAANLSGTLAGEITGTQSATIVSAVGGVTAANVAAGANLANAATTSSTANSLVKRDGSGNIPGVVDLSSNQAAIAGNKTFTGTLNVSTAFAVEARPGNTGTNTIFAGANAGAANTSGANNTFFGAFAGKTNTTGRNNTCFGSGAGLNNINGTNNAFFGDNAGLLNTGSQNTYMGSAAGYNNTSGSNNAFFGQLSGFSNNIGQLNVFIGNQAGQNNTSGGVNTFVGSTAGGANTTFSYSTFVGHSAGASNAASGNTAVGESALILNSSGANNIAIGNNAGNALTTGNNNIDIGHSGVAGEANIIRIGDGTTQTDTYLTGIIHGNGSGLTGISSLNLPTTTASVGAINQNGTRLLHAYGTGNFFAGSLAGNYTMTGTYNTASGINALNVNTTGASNVAIGAYALTANTTGSNNTSTGVNSLLSNTVGHDNTGYGYNALLGNTTGNYNTATGESALEANTSGSQNTANGFGALSNNTIGINNTGVGNGVLVNTSSGNGNTAIGVVSLGSNTTGSNNIGIGNTGGQNLTTGDNNIDIGHIGVAAEASTIRIGTSGSQTKTFIAGIRGVTTGSANGIAVLIDSNGQLGTSSSSRRYKEDITAMGNSSARIQALRPVTFRYKKPYDDGSKPIQYGLIAEEVAEVFPELAVYNDEGKPETVKYQDLVPMLLNEVQKLRSEKIGQEKTIESLDARLDRLEKALGNKLSLPVPVQSLAPQK